MRQFTCLTILLAMAAGPLSCGGGEREDPKLAHGRLRQYVLEGDYDAFLDMMTPEEREMILEAGRLELERARTDPDEKSAQGFAAHYGAPLEELMSMSPRDLIKRYLQIHLGFSYGRDFLGTSRVNGVEKLLGDSVRLHAVEPVGKRRLAFYDFTWDHGRWCWVFPNRSLLDPDNFKRHGE